MKKLEDIRRLLVVVDMVNGFVKDGALADRYIERIIPNINGMLKEFKNADNSLVAFVKDSHNDECSEFKKFPKHCISGTFESEVVNELKSYESDSLS